MTKVLFGVVATVIYFQGNGDVKIEILDALYVMFVHFVCASLQW